MIVFSIFSGMVAPIFPQKAEAQWLVFDQANFIENQRGNWINTLTSANTLFGGPVKEGGMDAVAWILANLVIERIAASTVTWINSGFKGSPAFITDPGAYFKDLGDKIAGEAIMSGDFRFLCGNLNAKVRIALARGYIGERNFSCKLSTVEGNLENFMNDFNRGGWDKFFILSQDQTQNPLGIYIQAEGDLARRIADQVGLKNQELAWGKGFLSFKKCASWSGAPTATDDPNLYDENGIPTAGSPQRQCNREEIVTPGDVISTQLNDVLGIGNDKLAVADEINEIVSALLNQLVSQVVGGIGKGLRGLSQPNSSNNNRAFIDQLANRNPGDTIVGYFCLDKPTDPGYDPTGQTCQNPDTPDTSIINLPPPYIPPVDTSTSTNPSINPISPQEYCNRNPNDENCRNDRLNM